MSKSCNHANFRSRDFDGFTRFGPPWVRKIWFWNDVIVWMSLCLSLCLSVTLSVCHSVCLSHLKNHRKLKEPVVRSSRNFWWGIYGKIVVQHQILERIRLLDRVPPEQRYFSLACQLPLKLPDRVQIQPKSVCLWVATLTKIWRKSDC